MLTQNKAVFLDRDGTIVVGVDYLNDPCQLRLLPNSSKGIKEFNKQGYLVIIVTNQSGIARGYFDEKRLKEINEKLKNILRSEGAIIDAIYYCPHMPEEEMDDPKNACRCRKPNPQMLLDAAKDFNIELRQSIMVGDTPADILTGKNAGCLTALIEKDKGFYDYRKDMDAIQPDFIVKDLWEVSRFLSAKNAKKRIKKAR